MCGAREWRNRGHGLADVRGCVRPLRDAVMGRHGEKWGDMIIM